MKQNEFDGYLENLVQEARNAILPGTPYEKPLIQGAMMGILACEEDYTFTGKQVAEIINTALNYKDPGNEGSKGQRKVLTNSKPYNII